MSRQTCAVDESDAFAPHLGPADANAVRNAVRELTRLADAGPPTLQRVARHLCVTSRTLQRRLRDAGTTYRQLVSEVRLELATRRLRVPGTLVMDAAAAAGFSEASCFHRAFKRWTGQTPKGFLIDEHEHD
jgi:AraC-like DNA-binding protein